MVIYLTTNLADRVRFPKSEILRYVFSGFHHKQAHERILQNNAMHCITLQHTATYMLTLMGVTREWIMQHTATLCNTMPRTLLSLMGVTRERIAWNSTDRSEVKVILILAPSVQNGSVSTRRNTTRMHKRHKQRWTQMRMRIFGVEHCMHSEYALWWKIAQSASSC